MKAGKLLFIVKDANGAQTFADFIETKTKPKNNAPKRLGRARLGLERMY